MLQDFIISAELINAPTGTPPPIPFPIREYLEPYHNVQKKKILPVLPKPG